MCGNITRRGMPIIWQVLEGVEEAVGMEAAEVRTAAAAEEAHRPWLRP
jgi:hypothetical protein